MKKLKKIIGFLMAVVMMMSTLSVVAQGRASYLDGYLTNYDDLDQPVVTFNQACTMVLDSVDVLLAEENMVVDLSILGELKLNSVNNAFADIHKLITGGAMTFFGWMLGDLNKLNVDALETPRRATTQNTSDTTVMYALVTFLSDNKDIFGKAIDGSLNLGIAKSFVDLSDLNVNQIVKEMLFEMVYPDLPVPEQVDNNTDTMIQKLITDLIQGKLDPETGEFDGFAPELVPYIDIVNTTASAYDFVETLLQQAWNVIVVPLINTELKKVVREACGVVYDELNPADTGDESELNEYADILDINFIVPPYTVPSGSTFVKELNNILAGVINAVTKDYTWAAGANTNLLVNFSAAAKYILSLAGPGLFPAYLELKPAEEVNLMNDQELFAYILRSLLNGSSDSLYIPADADSLVEVAWYAAKDALATELPAINYTAQPKTLAGVLFMLADLLASTLNESIDMKPGAGLIAYGQGFDATLLAVTNWARTNYGGLLNATFSTTDPWAAINTLFNLFVPVSAKWLPDSVNGNSQELLINRIIGGALNLDVTGILSLFDRVSGSEFATKTVKKILIDTFARVFNSIFPSAIGSFTSFETIITNANLAIIIKNILDQLNTRRTSIMPAITPLLAQVMDKSTPQAYQDPDVQLPTVVGAATSFAIRNDSTGINTGATDKDGNFVRDNLYKIKIVGVTSSIPAITVTPLTNVVINGGDEVTCSLGGTFTAEQQLVITVTYNVLTEEDTVLTPVPLSQRAFAYISSVTDDGKSWTEIDPESNNYHRMKYNTTYLNGPAAPVAPDVPGVGATEAEIAAYDAVYAQWQVDTAEYPAKKNATMQDLKDVYAQLIRKEKDTLHKRAATVSRKTCTVNATLVSNGVTLAPFSNISTTGDGGGWDVPYFTVGESATRPADGVYNSSYSYYATETQVLYTKETFNFTHGVVLYTDYGLPSLLSKAIEANRDPSDYSSATAYNNYITAVKNAVAVVYRPRVAATFMTTHAPLFASAATNLKAAIKALELTVISAGVEQLKTATDQIAPSNVYEDPTNPGMYLSYEYDNPNYKYMGKEDYVAYTYNRYKAERDNAMGIWESQQLPKEPVLPADPTPEEQDTYNTAYTQWVADRAAAVKALSPVKVVSVAYALNRFNLYAGRLVRVPAVKDRLNEAVALVAANMPLELGCSAAAWDKFERAYNFAVAVNADSDVALRQTKVNEARDMLIEAWKKTTQVFVEASPLTDTIIDNVNSYIFGLNIAQNLDALIQATRGASLVFHNTPNGLGTGTVVDLLSDGELVRSYTIIVYGDVNGDGNIDTIDAGFFVNLENYAVKWDPITDAILYKSGDLNGDGAVDSIDAGIAADAENYKLTIDQTTGLVA